MAQNKKWALDTNFLFDLARSLDEALTLQEIAIEKGYGLYVPPTVLDELGYKSLHGSDQEQKLADKALSNFGIWKISRLELPAASDVIADEFSKYLRERGALPQTEVNDGLILAEASLGGAALLASSDRHLTLIDPDELRLLFEDRGLNPIPVTTPSRLLSALEKQTRSAARY